MRRHRGRAVLDSGSGMGLGCFGDVRDLPRHDPQLRPLRGEHDRAGGNRHDVHGRRRPERGHALLRRPGREQRNVQHRSEQPRRGRHEHRPSLRARRSEPAHPRLGRQHPLRERDQQGAHPPELGGAAQRGELPRLPRADRRLRLVHAGEQSDRHDLRGPGRIPDPDLVVLPREFVGLLRQRGVPLDASTPRRSTLKGPGKPGPFFSCTLSGTGPAASGA